MKNALADLWPHLIASQLLHLLPYLLYLPPHSNQLQLLDLPWPLQFDGLHYWLNHYHYEPNFAFLPVFVWVLDAAKYLWGWGGVWAVVAVNRLLFVGSALRLRRLLALLGCSAEEAVVGSLVFLYGPASVFFHSVYSESLFVWLSWLALEQLLEGKSSLLPTGLLSLCVGIRSNGLFLSPVVGLELLGRAVSGRWSQRVEAVGAGVVSLAALCSGLGLHCWRGYEKWCGRGECMLNVYSYVQAKYWQVGLFQYFQLRNGLFIGLGVAALLPGVHSLLHWPRGVSLRQHGVYLSFAILFLVTVTMTNLQSSTRFFSSHPLFYIGIVRLGRTARWVSLAYCLTGLALFPAGFPWT